MNTSGLLTCQDLSGTSWTCIRCWTQTNLLEAACFYGSHQSECHLWVKAHICHFICWASCQMTFFSPAGNRLIPVYGRKSDISLELKPDELFSSFLLFAGDIRPFRHDRGKAQTRFELTCQMTKGTWHYYHTGFGSSKYMCDSFSVSPVTVSDKCRRDLHRLPLWKVRAPCVFCWASHNPLLSAFSGICDTWLYVDVTLLLIVECRKGLCSWREQWVALCIVWRLDRHGRTAAQRWQNNHGAVLTYLSPRWCDTGLTWITAHNMQPHFGRVCLFYLKSSSVFQ